MKKNEPRPKMPWSNSTNSLSSTESGPTSYVAGLARPPKGSRSHSSFGRNSVTNTHYADSLDLPSTHEVKSIKSVDNIPTVKPEVTRMDKLWTDIDVLDDVRNMSEEVKNRSSFFTKEFDEKLNEMKEIQSRLCEVVVRQDLTSNTNDLFRIHHLEKLSTAEKNQSKLEKEPPKISDDDLLSNIIEDNNVDLNKALYRKQNFEEMSRYVEDVYTHLEALGEKMKDFDSTTRDLW